MGLVADFLEGHPTPQAKMEEHGLYRALGLPKYLLLIGHHAVCFDSFLGASSRGHVPLVSAGPGSSPASTGLGHDDLLVGEPILFGRLLFLIST